MKKLISATLALAMTLAIATSANATAPAHAYRIGDVDGNGLVEIADALAILRYCVGMSSPIDNNPDAKRAASIIKRNGEPEVADALQILRYAVDLSNVITDTRLFAIDKNIISKGEFAVTVEMEMPFFGTVTQRSIFSGERVRIETFGMVGLRVDDNWYIYNESLDVWYIDEDGMFEIEPEPSLLGDSAILFDAGYDVFDGRLLYFEEYYFDDGDIVRYFFDGDELVGASAYDEEDDETYEMFMSVTADVPSDLFIPPTNIISYEEYFALVWGW